MGSGDGLLLLVVFIDLRSGQVAANCINDEKQEGKNQDPQNNRNDS